MSPSSTVLLSGGSARSSPGPESPSSRRPEPAFSRKSATNQRTIRGTTFASGARLIFRSFASVKRPWRVRGMLSRTSTTYPPMVQYLRTRRGWISCGEGFLEVACLPGACSDTGEAGKEAKNVRGGAGKRAKRAFRERVTCPGSRLFAQLKPGLIASPLVATYPALLVTRWGFATAKERK